MNGKQRRQARQLARKIREGSKTCSRCEATFYAEDKRQKVCDDCKGIEYLKKETRLMEEDMEWGSSEEKYWRDVATHNERFSDDGDY